MNKRTLFSALVIVAAVLSACGGGGAPAAPTAAPTAAGGAMTPQKGGSLTVAYKDDLATLDPAVGYDWTNWPA
ncbi:MAG: hypothetical protein HY023_17690, partial [Chloroflexi bacterium]|nr:hypothetical protein [Chloroflexota bacterium]